MLDPFEIPNEEKLGDLLLEWDDAREQGHELSPEDLCQDSPDLTEELQFRIRALKATDWLEEPDDDEHEDFLSLPAYQTRTIDGDDTIALSSSLTVEEFVKTVTSSGLMTEDEISTAQDDLPSDQKPTSAVELAGVLLKQNKLTQYQAKVFCRGKSAGLVLGDYMILDKIGAGGMGEVFKARHRHMKRVVALKVLPEALGNSETAIQRFEREVEAAARLEHPNIVIAHDAGEANGVHFLVMQYVDGQDLASLVKQNGPLATGQAVNYILQAARGLEYAHNAGIIHRDIKPANTLLDNEGTIKILDMGLARMDEDTEAAPQTALTPTGTVMGTVDYIAPEQALDSKHADVRSDVYSLGCMLYYLLTGEAVYDGDTVVKKIFAQRDQPIPSLSANHPHIPQGLDAVFQKMVAKQPQERQQTMSEVISELQTCGVMELPPVASQKDTMPIGLSDEIPASRKKVRRSFLTNNRTWVIAGGVLIAVALLAGILLTVETPAGTIILEIDQPELAGASVTVDGKQKITIKTGEGKQTIEIVADDKSHTLKVTQDGFEKFTKQFTVKAGNKQTIRVRLVPLEVAKKAVSAVSAGKMPPPAKAPFDAERAAQHQEAWARHLDTDVEITNSIGMKFRLIPPGEFLMGSTKEEVHKRHRREGPRHKVTITKPFLVSIHEVTRGQFRKFVEATEYKTDAEKDGKGGRGLINGKWVKAPQFIWSADLGFDQTDEHPIVNVSWNDATAFCEWLSKKEGKAYRLPTEAQWEYACRAGTTGRWSVPGDEQALLEEYAWYANKGLGATKPVAQKTANGFGLLDMHGNVWEWCQDRYGEDYYSRGLSVDPLGASIGGSRLLRGGSFIDQSSALRSANRLNHQPSFRYYNTGFRPARTYP